MTDAATLNRTVEVGPLSIANDRPFVLIAGPCALESRAHALETSHALVEMTRKLGIGLIYKSSFDKANRTSLGSARGLGLETSLPILAEVRETWGCPVLTDIHLPEQCGPVAEAVDVLQIPAFLSRQTDLLLAAAETGRAINVKKGQFLAPWDMENVASKLASTGNHKILLCERGVSFGYNTLVSDMRSLPDHGAHRLSSRVRRDALGPAAGRAGRNVRRPAGIRAGAGAGRHLDRGGGRLHGNPPGPGQGAERRPQHGLSEGSSGHPGSAGSVRPAG